MKPLVSILIPAHNAEEWIAETIQSAIDQTWQHREIIVVDDGSSDSTAAVARRYRSNGVIVYSVENQGAAAARNTAFSRCQGDYIQWLDADDLLGPEKIARQLSMLQEVPSKRILGSSPWAHFNFRPHRARFIRTALWRNLSPVEWLLTKLGENLHMQTATWLTSRELAEAAGPWDTTQLSDDDGEYFCRVLLASEGTRFTENARVYYRMTAPNRLSYVGNSDKKKDALLVSTKLHIQYLRSLEDSPRVRKACLTFLKNRSIHFFPERPDIIAELESLAEELQGRLETPSLRWKYAWMKPVLGWKVAKAAQRVLPQIKASPFRLWDQTMYKLESRGSLLGAGSGDTSPSPRK